MNPLPLGRRAFSTAAALALASVAISPLWAQGKPEKSKLSIAVTDASALDYLPLTLALQLGYFKAEGLEVALTEVPPGFHAAHSLVSGGADVMCGPYEHTIQLQGRNQFYQAFVLQARTPQIVVGASVKTLPNYKEPADLRGKRIGVAELGSVSHRVVNQLLGQAGIQPAEVSFLGVGHGASAVNAVRAGQVDVLSNADPAMTLLEQKGDVRILADTRTLKGTQRLFGGPMPGACLYASSLFLQKNPGTAQALANAVVHSLKWLQTAGPGDIINTVPEAYVMGDRGLYLAAFNKVRDTISPDGVLPEEGSRVALRATTDFEPDISPKNIRLSRTYTNEFARVAKDRFKA